MIDGEEEGSAFGESVAVSNSILAIGSTISSKAKGTVNLYSIQNVSVVVPFQQLHGQRAGVRDGDRFGHRIVLDHLGHILVALVATAPSHRVKAGAMEVYHRPTDKPTVSAFASNLRQY